MKDCLICGNSLHDPIYVSAGDTSITSLCTMIPGQTRVYFCDVCTHLQTAPIADVNAFYDENYKILTDSEEEDQLYMVVGDKKIFRSEHQIATLCAKVPIAASTKVLDFGCAKGATSHRLAKRFPGFTPHLFDVSRDYLPFWEKFVRPENWAFYQPKPEWKNYFDVVTSYYVMEHVVDACQQFSTIHSLLKPGGTFYFIVPNVYVNVIDFIVAEHTNHFSEPSLRFALEKCGFEVVEIDAEAHDLAFVITARKAPEKKAATRPSPSAVAALKAKAQEFSQYVTGLGDRVRAFETQTGPLGQAAIYGAGFYGSLIASQLRTMENVSCFIDQNPYLQGKTRFEKPIVAPSHLSRDIKTVYVGLNPNSAREIVGNIAQWRGAELRFFFL